MTVFAQITTLNDQTESYKAIMLWCPGCEKTTSLVYVRGGLHLLPVTGDPTKRPVWGWNGDLEKVTLSPSILTRNGDDICHSFLKDGVWDFLPDSTHKYAGQKVPMVPLPEWAVRN